MLTIEDLRNPKLKSGFHHVGGIAAPNSSKAHAVGPPGQKWRAETSPGPNRWRGPVRLDPAAAAQDYCDYINGKEIQYTPRLPSYSHPTYERREASDKLKKARAKVRELEKKEFEEKALWVYLAEEAENPDFPELLPNGMVALKIGHSCDPNPRAGGLQTGNPRPLRMLATIPGGPEEEERIQNMFAKYHIIGEWYRRVDEILEFFGVPISRLEAA